MADEDRHIASFQKNETEEVVMGINRYKEKMYFFIRIFVSSLSSGDLVRTNKGISLPIHQFPQIYCAIKELGEIVSGHKVVAQISKSNNKQVWVQYTKYKEYPLIDIRTYAFNKSKNEYIPTKKGVSINVELYQQLLDSIEIVSEEIGNDVKIATRELKIQKYRNLDREIPDDYEVQGLVIGNNCIFLNGTRVTIDDYPECLVTDQFECEQCDFCALKVCPLLKDRDDLNNTRIAFTSMRDFFKNL